MNLHPAKRCTIREPKKIASRGGRLSSALWILPNKNPGKINAGKKFNTGAVSESPPHRAWVKTVIVRQAVLLALDHSSPKPSQDLRPSGVSWVHSPIQWRDRAGVAPDFPIKPLRAPIPNMKLSRKSEYFRLLFWHHSVDLSTPDFHYPK